MKFSLIFVFVSFLGVLEEPDIFSNISGPSEVQKYLKNGTILCKLMNKIKPASIKHFDHNPRTPFQKMENISLFNEAIRLYGVQSEYVFVTNDLFEKKNMVQVLIGLRALGTIATANGVKPAIAI